MEALQDNRLSASRLHLADSNRPGGIVGQIEELAKTRAIDVQVHARQALSHISKNGKQDPVSYTHLTLPTTPYV